MALSQAGYARLARASGGVKVRAYSGTREGRLGLIENTLIRGNSLASPQSPPFAFIVESNDARSPPPMDLAEIFLNEIEGLSCKH